jgi:hypothetical protein
MPPRKSLFSGPKRRSVKMGPLKQISSPRLRPTGGSDGLPWLGAERAGYQCLPAVARIFLPDFEH